MSGADESVRDAARTPEVSAANGSVGRQLRRVGNATADA